MDEGRVEEGNDRGRDDTKHEGERGGRKRAEEGDRGSKGAREK